MLPYFTSEVYSWTDPENDDSGFKTGEIFGLSTAMCFRPSFFMARMYLNIFLNNEIQWSTCPYLILTIIQ